MSGQTTPVTGAATAAPSGTSYLQRAIDVTVVLGTGSFGLGGQNTVKLSGLRTVATVKKAPWPGMDTASMRVYGVPQSVMNSISSVGVPFPGERRNTFVIEAGDPVNGMSLVCTNIMKAAWEDFSDLPNTCLSLVGGPGTFIASLPTAATSYPAGADAATIIAGLAARAPPGNDRKFNNSGVQVRLASPYFHGSLLEQAHEVARQGNFNFYDDGTTWWIWPKNAPRMGANPLISPASGMLGYPEYTSAGIRFRCLYNPSIQVGGTITMQSSVMPANGQWYVREIVLNLAAQQKDGPWECAVDCMLPLGASRS